MGLGVAMFGCCHGFTYSFMSFIIEKTEAC